MGQADYDRPQLAPTLIRSCLPLIERLTFMNIRTTDTLRRRPNAFSLIEVTIAVAITAVALVSLMGMLPQGTALMKRATDTAIEARIHQQIVGEVLLTEWDSKEQFDNNRRGYDDQGIHIATNGSVFASGRNKEHIVYQARIRLPAGHVTLPGGSVDENLQLVLVDVTNRREESFDYDAAENSRHVNTYQSVIAKMGQNFGAPSP
jgi:uncharacterized protein (TIGR02598 family)